jgi:hypothetical protein
MSLESVGKLVELHSAVSSPAQQKAEKLRAEHEIVRIMFTSLMIGIAILGVGVFLLVVNKTLHLGAVVSMLASFLLLGGTGYAAFAVLNGIRKGVSLDAGKSAAQLPPATDKSLPTNPFPEALPSVTERTTQLISSSGTEQEHEVK